jgi:hypothetical protein
VASSSGVESVILPQSMQVASNGAELVQPSASESKDSHEDLLKAVESLDSEKDIAQFSKLMKVKACRVNA